MYKLTLLDKTTDTNGKIIKKYEPAVSGQVKDVSDHTWNLVQQGMREMIDYNSATFAGLGMPMAGKTGTAQQSAVHPDHILFVGFAPAESPQIAIAVRIANGYSSTYTAEIGRDIVKANFKLADKNEIITGSAAQLSTDIVGD